MNEHLYETPKKSVARLPKLNNHMRFTYASLRSGDPPHMDKLSEKEKNAIEAEIKWAKSEQGRRKVLSHEWLFRKWQQRSNDTE